MSGTTTAGLDVLSCPRCGGAPDPEGGPGHLARCRSCGVLGRIDDPEGRDRLAVMPAVDQDFAFEALRTKASRDGLAGTLRLHGAELLFVPFWRIRTLLAGIVQGEKPRTRRVMERTTLENGMTHFQWEERDDGTEKVHKEVQRSALSIVSASPLQEYGLPTLDHQRQNPGGLDIKRPLDRMGRVVVFGPELRRRGTVLDPLVTREQALAEAARLLDGQQEGMTAGLLDGAERDVAALDQELSLVFYPVHLLRFDAGGRRSTAAVDAVSGRVVSIRSPALGNRTLHDRRVITLAGLVSGFVVASLVRFSLLPPDLFEGASTESFRLNLLVMALLAGAGAFGGLVGLARYLGGKLR